MEEKDLLAGWFQQHRDHLWGVAYRLLGSASEADDALQEAWLRLSRTGADDVRNVPGWLTTIVARVALNMLRDRRTRREEPLRATGPEPAAGPHDADDPEREVVIADSVGLALLVVLDTLAPAERIAFVLHDMFAVPFGEIALIVNRSPAATRQLASRARRRVQQTAAPGAGTSPARQREIVAAFQAASRGGDFAALLALLDPDVEISADRTAVLTGASRLVRGAHGVAETFAGRARAAELALVDGAPGLVWAAGGRPRVVFAFTVSNDRITHIDLLADPDYLRDVELVMLGG
ncbi:MAG: sigma-70 family RNA polymerase sigma factor [Nonomuraea sp.]|nr:sigma-70 family RNA polymerase sigma factor [Nonomuraea sp.]NUP61169.1 sigma-70 family RNA polymerase sigma factor [Nonomuraea sp.]NUP81151.1 sigma-70 family RNA polymerase sigma factor [Nonomuraea sp.]NUS07275.1 sigma-70 family RNA polymerase sigma factor [Nonomuraea sp.]